MSLDARVAEVVGPIEGARAPWGAPKADLAARGYVVEEYQLSGTAMAYQLAPGTTPSPDGRWRVQEWDDAGYRTRILVIRPERADRFNGTVVVNWQNVSAGFEGGAPAGGEIYEGSAWVGVSAQEVGIYGLPMGMERRGTRGGRALVDVDPERYGTLVHPGDQGSFDIFAQAGRAVGPTRQSADGPTRQSAVGPTRQNAVGPTRPGRVDPLGGLRVERLIAAGGSQSAMRLATYVNALHAAAPTFDGFLLAVWEGRAPRPEEGPVAMGVRTAIRADGPAPIMIVNSEFEAPNLAALGVDDTEKLRVWEVAGTPHGVGRARDDRPERDGWTVNPLSYAPVHEAALRALHHWLADGVPARRQPRIEFDDGSPPTIRRDEHGNALGGIRLPELAAATHEYRGMSFGTGRPPLFGAARAFSDELLRAEYPSRAVFVDRWNAAVDTLVGDGAIRAEDAPAMRDRAAAAADALPLG